MKRRFLSIAALCLLAGATVGVPQTGVESAARSVVSLQIGERRTFVEDGRTIVYERIAPPARWPVAPAAQPVAPALAPALASVENAAEKPQHFAAVSATVLDHRVTLLRWADEATEYRAVSNLNFEHFAGLTTIETSEAVFSLFLALESAASTDLPADELATLLADFGLERVPDLADFPSDGTSCVLRGQRPAPAPASTSTESIAALHTHYAVHRWHYEQAWRVREAARLEAERRLRENPPAPPTVHIRYWSEAPVAVPAAKAR